MDSIFDDPQKFVMSGGDIKKVKDFNNAVRRPFFKIQLLQVHVYINYLAKYSQLKTNTYRFAYLAYIYPLDYFTVSSLSLKKNVKLLTGQ